MDVEGFWNKIASYNFIQEPMKGIHEVPSLADYETAWKCLADVVQIIKPDICIFVGLRNDNGMNALEGKEVKYSIQTLDEKSTTLILRKVNCNLLTATSYRLYDSSYCTILQPSALVRLLE